MKTVITIRCIVNGDKTLAESLAQCAVSDLQEDTDSRVCFQVGDTVPLTPADERAFQQHIELMEEDDEDFEDEDFDEDED